MSMLKNVQFKRPLKKRSLTFNDLEVGDGFVINTPNSRGAVYQKVQMNRNGAYYMLELATGKLFDPTFSMVKKVDYSITIDTDQPSIYQS